MIRLRPDLTGLAPYVPGRAGSDVVDAAARVARLASNERPYPPAAPVLDAIAAAAAELHRYPDDEVTALTEALATARGVELPMIAVGNGSSELLARFALATCGPGATAVFAWPSFVMYPILAALTGASARRVPLVDGRHDLAAMADAVDDSTAIVFVCTPNNPTGCAVGGGELGDFLARVPADVLIVLDEAYAEYVDPGRGDVHADGVALVAAHPNVVVLRTFSKAYGLAGLRCGYAVGASEVLAALNKTRMPFVVNSLAQSAATAALRHADACLAPVAEAVAERQRITTALARMGVHVPESHGNFVWLDGSTGDVELAALAAACERAAVMVRPLGPGPDGIRVTIGTPAENDRFLEVVAGS